MPLSLKSLSAIVTGGNSGLGLATAKRLLESGSKVLVADLSDSNLNSLKGDLLFHKTDVSCENDAEAAIKLAITQYKKIDVLVNCAGIGIAERTYNPAKKKIHDLENFSKVIKINTIGTYNMIRLVSSKMAENEPNGDGERGCIINTASVAAFEGQIGQAAYSASKGAIVGMTLPIARDLSRLGIRVMTIAPGLFETPLLASLPPAVQQHLVKTIPFPHRLGKPEEYGQLVTCIIENPMLNGETIRLDGALRMQP